MPSREQCHNRFEHCRGTKEETAAVAKVQIKSEEHTPCRVYFQQWSHLTLQDACILTYETAYYERIFNLFHNFEILEVKHLFFTLLSELARKAGKQGITELFHLGTEKFFG